MCNVASLGSLYRYKITLEDIGEYRISSIKRRGY